MITIIRLSDRVRPEPLGDVERVRHGYDAGRVRLGQLIDKIDDFGELFDALDVLVFASFESRQRCYLLDLVFIE